MTYPLVLLILLSALLCAGCAEPPAENTATVATVADVSATQALAKSDTVTILDVRTPAEFSEGHIPGAINIDVNSENFARLVAELDRESTYVVHCTSNVPNGRSARALEQMQGLGFSKLENMTGGYVAYVDATTPNATDE